MGKGDKKTAKGKRTMGSYGNSRKRKSSSTSIKPSLKKTESVTAEKKPSAAKKTKAPAAKKTAVKKAATTEKKTTKKKAE
jgi:ribosomal small subunit protein bTHX